MNKVIIAGCGYLGQRLAQQHRHLGDSVVALVQSSESQAALTESGLDTLRLDLDQAQTATFDANQARIYWLIPPPPNGESDERTRSFTRLLQGQRPEKVVVISTTGVYGDCQGEWVTEDHPVNPKAPRALRRWSSEQQWQHWCTEQDVARVTLRLPGIYGPGRLPLARLQKRLPMIREADAPWSNRIHIDDLVQVCLSAMNRETTEQLFNVSDGHPSTMLDYFNRIADLAGLPRPQQISREEAQQTLSAEMMSYLSESRRIDNRRMLRSLDIRLRYPSLSEGLPACFPSDGKSGAEN